METERIEYRGFWIVIHIDPHPQDPRKEDDNMGHMVCFHNRYTLGDEHNFPDGDAVREYLKANNCLYLPLFLFDHSGLTMSTSDGPFRAADPQGWDWGQVGVIYITPAKIKEEYGDVPDAEERALKYLQGEVQEYGHYLSGEVYGYTIEPKETNKGIECDDSCWGFIGREYMLEFIETEVKPEIDSAIKGYFRDIKAANDERKQCDHFMSYAWAL